MAALVLFKMSQWAEQSMMANGFNPSTQEAELISEFVSSLVYKERIPVSKNKHKNNKTIKKKKVCAAFPYDQSSVFSSRDLTRSSGLNGKF